MSDAFNDAGKLRQELGEVWPRMRQAEAQCVRLAAELAEANKTEGRLRDAIAAGVETKRRLEAELSAARAALADEVREHCAMRDTALEVGNVTLAGWHWARANVLNKALGAASSAGPALSGMQVVIDPTMPEGTAELRCGESRVPIVPSAEGPQS